MVHKNSCAILLIMPMLNMDVRSRSFRNKTPAFLFLGNHRLGSALIIWEQTIGDNGVRLAATVRLVFSRAATGTANVSVDFAAGM